MEPSEPKQNPECVRRGCEPGPWEPYDYGGKQVRHCTRCGRVICVATMPEEE